MSDAIEAKGTTIFVTGVNGHIGNHIVRDLLEQGYNVKGSIRDLEDPLKVDHVRKHASDLNSEDRLELVQADVLDADDWATHLKGCDGLFHTATIYATSGDANLIIDTANKGTQHLFSAAKEAGIQRVIYTSSIAAIGSTPKGREKTEADWQTERTSPYIIAKTESERLAWKLAERLELDLRVINPGGVLGGGFVRPTPSVEWFDDAMKGLFPMAPKIPMAFVHVTDVAIAHRKAFETEEAGGRFIVAPHNNSTVAAVCKRIRELYPETKSPKRAIPVFFMPIVVFQDWMMSLFGAPRRMTRKAVKGYFRGDANLSSKKASEELGIEWKSFDECIHDTVREFL
ncbi:MAG: NAD-dependent epimerase/dehydratase family protein [Candidatus Poseidoniaceae archaeon]|tara:strand:+ start:20 stop:1048 length:1029 start_codon:yes stop_codon:yes gene_type:complete